MIFIFSIIFYNFIFSMYCKWLFPSERKYLIDSFLIVYFACRLLANIHIYIEYLILSTFFNYICLILMFFIEPTFSRIFSFFTNFGFFLIICVNGKQFYITKSTMSFIYTWRSLSVGEIVKNQHSMSGID